MERSNVNLLNYPETVGEVFSRESTLVCVSSYYSLASSTQTHIQLNETAEDVVVGVCYQKHVNLVYIKLVEIYFK